MTKSASTPSQLPASFKAILWPYDFAALDPKTHKKAIIVNTVNYGDLAHWHWIIEHYGKAAIREVLETVPATELRPRARRLATIIFALTPLHDTPRGTH